MKKLVNLLLYMVVALAVTVAPPAWAKNSKEGVVLLQQVGRPQLGDLPDMIKRRAIRVLTTVALGQYYLDHAEQRGVTYELMQKFEAFINADLKAKKRKERVQIVMIPVAFDQLIPSLISGKGDIAAASLTITPSRAARVAFSEPLGGLVRELVVTGPGADKVTSFDDLVKIGIAAGKSTSYYESLLALNEQRAAAGKPVIPITLLDDRLQDADVMEMVNAGMLPAAVVDDRIAEFWAKIFTDVDVHQDMVLRGDGRIGWAMRQTNPELKAMADAFIATQNRGGSSSAITQMVDRYLKSTKWATNALSPTDRNNFRETANTIERYADRYGFDWIMVAAQGYQESRLDQTARSNRGAVGVMQLLPTTAADPSIGIRNIEGLDGNIHAGVKYLSVLRHKYYEDPALSPSDKMFFSFAAYNAGPGNINKARNRARKMGLDPNVWFDNVEIATGSVAGQEPVRYVRNILKYYVAYSLAVGQRKDIDAAKTQQ